MVMSRPKQVIPELPGEWQREHFVGLSFHLCVLSPISTRDITRDLFSVSARKPIMPPRMKDQVPSYLAGMRNWDVNMLCVPDVRNRLEQYLSSQSAAEVMGLVGRYRELVERTNPQLDILQYIALVVSLVSRYRHDLSQAYGRAIATDGGHLMERCEQSERVLGSSNDEAYSAVLRPRVLLAKKELLNCFLLENRGVVRDVETVTGIPKTRGVPDGYFEVPVSPLDAFLCSDDECPCTGDERLTLGDNGYVFISEEVVKERRQTRTWAECLSRQERMAKQMKSFVVLGLACLYR
jgi:hypothetical protein